MKKTMKAAMMVACLTGTGLSAADFSLGSISTGVSEIDNAIGEVNSILDDLSGYTTDSILSSINQENELLGCLVSQNINLSNIGIGDIAGTINTNVCSSFNSDILSGAISSTMSCGGISMNNGLFSSVCGSTATDPSLQNPTSSSTSTPSAAQPTGHYDSPSIFTTAAPNRNITGGANTTVSSTPLSQQRYPSGLTIGDIYSGDGGGKLYNALFTKPDGADADAIKNNNVSSLILKDLALKLQGSTDENTINLPSDQMAVLQGEISTANAASVKVFNFNDLENKLVAFARVKFAELDADTLNEYYNKEMQAYADMIASDENVRSFIAQAKEATMSALDGYYNMKLIQLKKRNDYLPNTSYTIERITKKSARDNFKVKALLQMNDETLIKSEMASEKRKINIKIDRTIQQAYYKASIFRADIAKKEIDTILKAVDTAIK